MTPLALPDDFRALSAKLGKNPLQVQGPGGNTSIKGGGQMWIKASGTELAHAQNQDIFVRVDQIAAAREAAGGGDGSCTDTVLDPNCDLRPSIETTFHALLDWAVVLHTHSIVTLAHATSRPGLVALKKKLAGLAPVCVPYRKPGGDLTRAIQARIAPTTQVIVLENHGLIIAAESVGAAAMLQGEVERRLALPAQPMSGARPSAPAPEGYEWHGPGAQLAQNPALYQQAKSGSFYPDHLVFLGSGLGDFSAGIDVPAALVPGQGLLVHTQARDSARAMVQCLIDFFAYKPSAWVPEPIGTDAEAALQNWDAEKYRQALAKNPVSTS